jgi:hypothetical protein
MSFEVLYANYGAQLRRTEMEIEYWPASKITDYSITVMVCAPPSKFFKFRFYSFPLDLHLSSSLFHTQFFPY